MSDQTKVLIRNTREQDIPTVVEIDNEAFAAQGTAEKPDTLRNRLTAFPNGFVTLVAENEIAGFGCSEKWLEERQPGLDQNPLITHQPDGRIFCITAMAVKKKFQGRGYRLLLLDKLIETAHLEGCKKVLVETSHAQDLYRQRGFETVKKRMERGVPVEVMSLELKPIRMIG
jgi:ribosomal protein S18 acetylase RimI-like enzyme